jgi:hypothetical protein
LLREGLINLKIIAFIGIVIFILSLAVSFSYRSMQQQARQLDERQVVDDEKVSVAGETCSYPDLTAIMSRRVIAQNDSEVVNVMLSHTRRCQVDVTIIAPSFQISPPDSTRSVSLTAENTANLSWLLSAREMGSHQILIQAGFQSINIGVTVTNAFGLKVWQAELVGYLGSFFGPALTFPWLYETWRERQREKEEKEQEGMMTEKTEELEKEEL